MSDFPSFFGISPSPQNALDLFGDEWSSRFPAEYGELRAGATDLFCDPRLRWADEQLGIRGKEVLELGPLEAAHTWMLLRLGAASVTAVEAAGRAYLKCLITKEITGMDRARFQLGDAVEYLENTDRLFDIGFACGLLYHLEDPVLLLERLVRRCRSLFIWTVYYDPAFVSAHPEAAAGFSEPVMRRTAGFAHTLHPWNYGTALDWKGFCGGGAPTGCWMEKAEILGALRHFGCDRIETLEEANVHGSAILIAAERS